MCVCMVQSINILSYSKKLDEEREIIGMNDSIVINVFLNSLIESSMH